MELLRDNEPAVLLDEGDPESLTQSQRNQALRAYAHRYGPGGWRGLRAPQIQVHRFASKELADEIDKIWQSGVENPDVREVLFNLVELGRIEACSDIVFDAAQNFTASAVERITALDALVALDDKRLERIAESISDADDLWPDRVARGAVLRLFPKYMSAEQLCRALRWMKVEKRSALDLSWQLPRLVSVSALDFPVLEKLRDSLLELISEGLKWRDMWPHITSDRPHLSGVLAATCIRGLEMSADTEWLHAGVVALRLHHRDHGNDDAIKSLHERLSNMNAEGNARLFWVEDAFLQSIHEAKDPWTRLAEITIHDGPVRLRPDRDLNWGTGALGDMNRDIGERAMLLEAAIRLSPESETLGEHIGGLKCLVEDEPSFVQKLEDWLKPSKHDKARRRWEKKQTEREIKEKRQKSKSNASWVQFWRKVANQPGDVFSSDQSWNTAWNLWRAMRHDGDDSRASGWNRRFIEEQFNQETADRLRRLLMNIWRDDCPTPTSERSEGERNTTLVSWQLCLAAIYAESEDPEWAKKLSDTEAELAARYAPIELSGLPQWIDALVAAHPIAVDQVLGNELSLELYRSPGTQGHLILLQHISYSSETVARLSLPRLETWLDAGGDRINGDNDATGMTERVRQVTKVILEHGDAMEVERLRERAVLRSNMQLPFALRLVWLSILMRVDTQVGVEHLESQIVLIEPAERSEAVTWFACLFGDRQDAIGLNDESFTPRLLLRLLRLAYRHVRVQDDVHHEGSFSSDTRDNAEQARSNIVTALFNATGEEGLAAKFEMAADPLCAHFKDRILAVAEENWGQEIDGSAFDSAQAVALDRSGEAPASTNEAMFAIMKDRLSDLDDLLLRDVSPRDAWAGISKERVMRREIARELSHAANAIYTVDQEAVTADEKETDIRLRSVTSRIEAAIELKLADRRTAKDLRDTIENQLVKKYMAAEHNQAGALLVTLAKDRKWEHPDEKRRIDVEELCSLLRKEAERLEIASGGALSIAFHFLDLRPRLQTEREKKPRDHN